MVGPIVWLDSSNGHYLIHNWVMYMGKNTFQRSQKECQVIVKITHFQILIYVLPFENYGNHENYC